MGGTLPGFAKSKILRIILGEMGHMRLPTSVHCGNSAAAGLPNDSLKKASFTLDGNIYVFSELLTKSNTNMLCPKRVPLIRALAAYVQV